WSPRRAGPPSPGSRRWRKAACGGPSSERSSAPPCARASWEANASVGIVDLLTGLLDVYVWVIIAAALITWVSPDPRNPVVMFLRQVTEPVLAPVRRLLPPWKTGGLDFSPLIVILAIQFVERVILPGLLRAMY